MKLTSWQRTVISKCKWYKDHKTGKAKLSEAQLKWLCALSDRDLALACEYPINCMVNKKEGEPVAVPWSGELGVVIGYKDGYLLIKQKPDSGQKCYARPDQIELVAFWRGITPSKIKRDVAWYKCKLEKQVEAEAETKKFESLEDDDADPT